MTRLWATTLAEGFLERSAAALDRQRKICANPTPVAGQVFSDLLDEVSDTSFGRAHAIGSVRTEQDWKKAVPIRPYEELAGYVRRQLAGERRVLTADEPYAFLRTSGTTGSAKLVPTTSRWRIGYRSPALSAQWGLYFERMGVTRLCGDEVLDLSWEPRAERSFEQGFPVYGITERPLPHDERDWAPPWSKADWFPWDPAAPTLADSLYMKLLRLAGRDVQLIVAVNPSKIVLLAETLSKNAERLLGEVHAGRAGVRVADAALARRLAAVFERSGGQPLLTDLWPSLRLLVCWNSASAGLYRSWLAHLAPGVARLPFSTTGTEGIVTLPVDAHPSAGPLAVDQGHFEFVPWDNLYDGGQLAADTATLGFHELAIGGTYRMVMSQINGLCRNDVGDVYRVAGLVGATPRLEFLGRAGSHSSFTGEKVTESDVHTAVTRVLGSNRATHPDFSGVPVWGTPPHYLVAVEWNERDMHLSVEEVGRRIDDVLQEVNIEYADKRTSGRLQPLKLIPLVPGAFLRIAEQNFRNGVAGSQIKHHWLYRDATLLTTLRDLDLLHHAPAGG